MSDGTDRGSAGSPVPVPSQSGVPWITESGRESQFSHASQVVDDGGTDVRRYVAALLRHKWLVAVTVALGTAAGWFATRILPPVYEVRATVIAAVETPGPEPIQTGHLLADEAWIDLLKSFRVLDGAVEGLRLYLRHDLPSDSAIFRNLELAPRFSPGAYELSVSQDGAAVTLRREGVVVETAAIGDSVGRVVGLSWRPDPAGLRSGASYPFEITSPRALATSLRSDLRVTTDRRGNFFHVQLQGGNPTRITTTVNAVVERFVDVAAEIKRATLTEKVGILQRQLANAERNLRQAEERLERFRVETITLPSERASPIAPGLELTQDPVFENYFGMQVELENLRRDRETIERLLAAGEDPAWNPLALESVGEVQQSSNLGVALEELTNKRSELRALRSEFTDEHPQIVRLAASIESLERVTIPALASELVTELSARIQDIQNRLSSAGQELQEVPPRIIEEARLARDVVIAENLYTVLQARFEESRLAEVSSIADVRILDPAIVPQRPATNNAQRFLLMGFMGGLGLGVVAALLLDRTDRRVRYPEQVTEKMGLPILGVVPHLRSARNGRVRQAAPVVEALRGVRLNLLHAFGSAGSVVLTVTSPGSGDGKSFVSSNLALALADAGRRTLLVDADTRRGSLHRVLGLKRKPGLTDALAQKLPVTSLIQRSEFTALDFLGGGTRVANAPELIGSSEMAQLVADLRGLYDAVVVDSPPLGAGVDAYALGSVTRSLVLVLRTGLTDRQQAEARLDVLDRLPIRVLGAVLNGVKESEGYGYQYYSYYMPGYELEAETGAGQDMGDNKT